MKRHPAYALAALVAASFVVRTAAGLAALGACALPRRVHLLRDRPLARRLRPTVDPRRLRALPGAAPADHHRPRLADRRRRDRLPGRPGDRRARDVARRGSGVPARPPARAARAGRARARRACRARSRPRSTRRSSPPRRSRTHSSSRRPLRGDARTGRADAARPAPVRRLRRPGDARACPVRRPAGRLRARRPSSSARGERRVQAAVREQALPLVRLRSSGAGAARRPGRRAASASTLGARVPRRPARRSSTGRARRDGARLRVRLDHRSRRAARALAGARPPALDRRARVRRRRVLLAVALFLEAGCCRPSLSGARATRSRSATSSTSFRSSASASPSTPGAAGRSASRTSRSRRRWWSSRSAFR